MRSLTRDSEALLLLYGLMDSVPPSIHREPFASRPEFAVMSMDKYASNDSAAASASSRTATDAAPSQSRKSSVRTEVDSLEDSFKFAVGIVAPSSNRKPKSRASSGHARTGAAAATATSSPFGGSSSFEVPEEVLLRDVLYALQAIDSRYLYFDAAADRFQITRSVGVPTRTC